MPDPALLSATGQAMLAELPPPLRTSYDYLAVIHAYAREIDLLEASIEVVRAQFNPATADVLLDAWETIVKLPVGGNGASTATRRTNVIARLRKLLGQAEGLQWVQTLDGILPEGWTYAEHDPDDPSSPPPGVIHITVPLAAPSEAFTEAARQIRELTAAHLGLAFEATDGGFLLDLSEMDVQDFGN